MRIDRRPTLSRAEARCVYDGFAAKGHIGGNDASSGYGGPAVAALLTMAAFADASCVFEYGCGQGKLAELVLGQHNHLTWHGVDQSPLMIDRARERLMPYNKRAQLNLLPSGAPEEVGTLPDEGGGDATRSIVVDRFVSTYVLDLLSERDMNAVLDLAQARLHPTRGKLLLAGITWGYRDSWRTCLMTLLWEILYRLSGRTRKIVGGCRPQHLEPYLRARGWTIEASARTLPTGFPWMVSEVVAARPPPPAGAPGRSSSTS